MPKIIYNRQAKSVKERKYYRSWNQWGHDCIVFGLQGLFLGLLFPCCYLYAKNRFFHAKDLPALLGSLIPTLAIATTFTALAITGASMIATYVFLGIIAANAALSLLIAAAGFVCLMAGGVTKALQWTADRLYDSRVLSIERGKTAKPHLMNRVRDKFVGKLTTYRFITNALLAQPLEHSASLPLLASSPSTGTTPQNPFPLVRMDTPATIHLDRDNSLAQLLARAVMETPVPSPEGMGLK